MGDIMWKVYYSLLFLFFSPLCRNVYSQTKINQTLECSWLEYDYGEVNIGEIVTCALVIKNISKRVISIEQIINGCPCVSAESDTKVLRPKGKASFRWFLSVDAR